MKQKNIIKPTKKIQKILQKWNLSKDAKIYWKIKLVRHGRERKKIEKSFIVKEKTCCITWLIMLMN